MNKNIFSLIAAIIIILGISCDDSYIIGGEINATNRVEMTTFDYLKSQKETDTVALLFEKAGLKDIVNGDVTIISPSQWSVNRYLRRRTTQTHRVNPEAPDITINDISNEDLQQMKMYILPGKLWSQTIPEKGKIVTALDGTEVFISYDEKNTDPAAAWDGGGQPGQGYQYSNFLQSIPKLVHVHFKRGNNWEWKGEERSSLSGTYNNPECDQVYRMYLSDVLTLTGVVHILYVGDYNFSEHSFYHSLFFYGTTNDDKL